MAALLLMGLFLFFTGCAVAQPGMDAAPAGTPSNAPASTPISNMQKYTYTFTGTFDTVITLTAYANDQAQFDQWAEMAQQRFAHLHKLFDQFNDYPGVNNIKTINDQAGNNQPIKVDPLIIQLVQDSISLSEQTGAKVNIAMGAVLRVWSELRDQPQPQLPDMQILKQKAQHMDMRDVVIDQDASTVYLRDAQMSLDVGAVAKGFATAIVADELAENGAKHVLINSGASSITMVGAPADRPNWVVALRNPMAVTPDQGPQATQINDVPDYIATLAINSQTISNSGDYQRFVIIDGVRYHHLIDPDTLMPAQYYRAVSVVTSDAYTSDFISSALYLLPYEQSRELAESLGVEAMWVFNGMRTEMTDGMKQWLQPQK